MWCLFIQTKGGWKFLAKARLTAQERNHVYDELSEAVKTGNMFTIGECYQWVGFITVPGYNIEFFSFENIE